MKWKRRHEDSQPRPAELGSIYFCFRIYYCSILQVSTTFYTPRLPDISRKSTFRFILSNEPIVFGIWYRISRSNYSALLTPRLNSTTHFQYRVNWSHVNLCKPALSTREYNILLFLFELRPVRAPNYNTNSVFSFSFSNWSIPVYYKLFCYRRLMKSASFQLNLRAYIKN